MKKKLSIHDIAKQLNVSAATISFVLNGKATEKRISGEMEQRILRHVKQSGYRPNRVAKSLRTGKSRIIGMLVEGIADPFFSAIARNVEEQAYKLDYKIFYASTENEPRIARDIIGAFRDTQVDGYIIVPPPGIEEDIQDLLNDNLPVVLFDRYFPEVATCNIVVDNFDGVYQAMRHFIKYDYKNIGFVTIHSTQTQMRDRLNGYHHAINESGLSSLAKILSFDCKPVQEKITQEIKQFLEENPQIDAILFATNYLATSGLEAIKQLRLSIPNDIVVIGFDDNTYFSLFSPSVTAVAQPIREISDQVMHQLMTCLTGSVTAPAKKTIVLKPKLIVRESSQRAGGHDRRFDPS